MARIGVYDLDWHYGFYKKKIFNLDLMNSEELELLLEHIEKEKNKVKKEFRKNLK